MPDVVTFSEALGKANQLGGNKHLLLGNGFSIAWRPEIFVYGSLFERADFSQLSVNHKKLFGSLNTTDFESIMQALKSSATLADVYETSDQALASKMRQDSEFLKDILVQTIAKSHPELPTKISDKEYEFCKNFLLNFSEGKIFTLNYDLLLYWVLMHSIEKGEKIRCDDGFRKAEDQEDFVEWRSFNSQNIYYLHGALHLFDHGYTLEKYTWINTGHRLMEQIRSALDLNKFPLVVTEGESNQKLSKITHSGYLHKGLRSFETVTGSLFIHGHSLSDSDDHFFSLIPESKISNLFVSLHNISDLSVHQAKFRKLESLQERRKQRFIKHKNPEQHSLNLFYYDASTAHVWQ